MRKTALLALDLALALASGSTTGNAAEHRWLKRVGAIAVCAAGAFDAGTTFAAYGRDPGGHENSGLLSGPNGKPSPWRFGVVKGGMCAAAFVVAENRRAPAWASLAIMAPLAVPQVVAGAGNMGVKPQK